MHYCESGTLSSIITSAKKTKSSISENQIIKWLLQLSLALHHMHELCHILHRDLKPMNVMLTEGGEIVKLCDFGLAVQYEDNSNEGKNGGEGVMDEAGTPYYTAPEIIMRESYSYPADCWSLGIILYQLLSLDRPFEGNSTSELVKSILTTEPVGLNSFTHFSDDIK